MPAIVLALLLLLDLFLSQLHEVDTLWSSYDEEKKAQSAEVTCSKKSIASKCPGSTQQCPDV